MISRSFLLYGIRQADAMLARLRGIAAAMNHRPLRTRRGTMPANLGMSGVAADSAVADLNFRALKGPAAGRQYQLARRNWKCANGCHRGSDCSERLSNSTSRACRSSSIQVRNH